MLNQILKSLGFEPNKIRPHQVVYKSPFNPTERTPSFFVFPNSQNGEWTNWKDYASGAGGDHYKFLMEYFQIGFIEAKEKLKEILGNQHHIEPKRPIAKPSNFSLNQQKKSYEIKKVQPLQNRALIEYLEKRGISFEIGKRYLDEIYYKINNKNYFGLAFKNNYGGYEVRNRYFKGAFGTKDITTITSKNSTNLKVFEGYIDFLSYLEITHNCTINHGTDYLILNSISLIDRALKSLLERRNSYLLIELYFDNDKGGDSATLQFKKFFANKKTIDKRTHYKKYKDINEMITNYQ
jgi:DNA primase